jgi:Domain of unknown function (DUF5664)
VSDFVTKDSGDRKTFASGMNRDITTGKFRPDLVADGPMLLRWIGLMTRGAEKYAARNWMLADGVEELERFRESAFRHFMQWYLGINAEEDHAAAIFFNCNGAEYVKSRLNSRANIEDLDDVPPVDLKTAIQQALDAHPY